jgi:hypothetical protein
MQLLGTGKKQKTSRAKLLLSSKKETKAREVPHLALMVGNDGASLTYGSKEVKACERVVLNLH